MSLTSKDMVFGAAGAAAFLGLVVYHQHKFNKLQGEIDELKEETRIMAQYIKILESKVAGDFQTILSSNDHHHHHAHAALPAAQPVQASQVTHTPQPALEDVKPRAPIIPENRRTAQPVHVRQPVKQAAPVRAQPVKQIHQPVAPAKRAVPVKQMPVRKPVAVQQEESESVDSQEDNQKEDVSESESERSDDESAVQNSNRRTGNNPGSNAKPVVSQGRDSNVRSGRPTAPNAGVRSTNQPQNPVPRNPPAKTVTSDRAPPPAPQKHVITVEEGRPPKDKEESYNPAEENNKATEISGGRPTPPKAGGPRTTGPKSGGEKKRFGPKTDDSEDSDKFVSSSKIKTKSILKSGSRAEKDEASIDADLADDMELVGSKSAKREEDNEGREVGQSAARANMAKTAKIAEDMRKKREEREQQRKV